MSDRVLTVWQPWASAIIFGGKDIENRTWAPPQWLLHRRIWIHAGMRMDSEDTIGACMDAGYDWRAHPEHHIHGAIIGSVRLDGWLTSAEPSGSPWFGGPVGWLLANPVAIDPVYYRGRQGLWVRP